MKPISRPKWQDAKIVTYLLQKREALSRQQLVHSYHIDAQGGQENNREGHFESDKIEEFETNSPQAAHLW